MMISQELAVDSKEGISRNYNLRTHRYEPTSLTNNVFYPDLPLYAIAKTS